MDWIQKNKTLLWFIEAIAILGMIFVLLIGRSLRDEIETWQLGLITLPWILCLAAGLPLIYSYWFAGPSPGPLFVFRKVTFWLFVSIAVALVSVFYGVFMLQFL